MPKILAAVILHDPDICQLKKCLAPIANNVDLLYFIDNASRNETGIINFVNKIPNAQLVRNSQNQGLSRPFNRLLKYSKKHIFSHLLLLDQDSEPSPNFMEELKKHADKNYVCYTPLLIHKSLDYQKTYGCTPHGETETIKESINSGTLINLNELPADICFDENLFIDWIDIDFFYQLELASKKILRINNAKLLINIGNQKVHHIFKYTWFSSGYSAFRLNKQSQDTVYFYLKYRKHNFVKGHVTFLLWRWLMMLFFEKNRIKKSFAIISGIVQGFRQYKSLY
ncbi:MAG: glycosyltransferase [Eubacteriales bacterium]|nr:glycosyltransferase [Eubacteriales bacterium]